MSTTTSTVNGEVVSKHSMFETKLPAVSQASGARDAAAHAAGRVTTPLVDRDKSANRGIVPPVKSSSGEARHAHSLCRRRLAPPRAGRLRVKFLSELILYNAASVDFEPKVIVQVPTTDEATTDHTRLDTRLKLYNLQEKVVRGDGNCQFRAVADQLFRDQERHAECRNVVINQLRRSSEDYAPYVPEDFDDYVRAMREDAAWGDHVTSTAADAYGVHYVASSPRTRTTFSSRSAKGFSAAPGCVGSVSGPRFTTTPCIRCNLAALCPLSSGKKICNTRPVPVPHRRTRSPPHAVAAAAADVARADRDGRIVRVGANAAHRRGRRGRTRRGREAIEGNETDGVDGVRRVRRVCRGPRVRQIDRRTEDDWCERPQRARRGRRFGRFQNRGRRAVSARAESRVEKTGDVESEKR